MLCKVCIFDITSLMLLYTIKFHCYATLPLLIVPGSSIPSEAMMHSSVSDSPYFRKFLKLMENFPILPFPKKLFSDIHPPKFLMTIFSHRLKIFNFPPIFAVSVHLSHFRKLLFPPTFKNFPLISLNLRVFYILSVFFVSPYFDHDAFMHHTMHTLDAHGPRTMILYCVYQVMNIQLFCTSVFDHKKSKYIMSVLWL